MASVSQRVLATFALGLLPLISVNAAESSPATTVAGRVTGRSPQIEAKSARLLQPLKIEDAAKEARAKSILADWLVELRAWHEQNDPQLKELWAEWNKARAVVPKDEFPAEVIAHRIDDVYASLRQRYAATMDALSQELSPGQIDTLKETWSRSPGMRRTYNAYLEIVPDLKEDQKQVILSHMLRAREDAMLTDSDREIVNIFKRHKVKVEAYVGSLQWTKLHRAYANRGK